VGGQQSALAQRRRLMLQQMLMLRPLPFAAFLAFPAAKEPASLARFRESEVYHCRWAMLGAAGVLGVEVLGYGNWYDAPLPLVQGGNATYFGATVPFDLGTLAAIEFAAFAAAESFRGAAEPEKRVYPGGAFDPMGMVRAWCGGRNVGQGAGHGGAGKCSRGSKRE